MLGATGDGICSIAPPRLSTSSAGGVSRQLLVALGRCAPEPDGWVVRDISDPQLIYDVLVAHAGLARVLALAMLTVRGIAARTI